MTNENEIESIPTRPKRPETIRPFHFTGIEITDICMQNGIGKAIFEKQPKSEVGSMMHRGLVTWDCNLGNCGFGLNIEKNSATEDVLAIDFAYPDDIDRYKSLRIKIGNVISRNPLKLEFLDNTYINLDEKQRADISNAAAELAKLRNW
jgi:hypothetical protein